MPSGRDDWETIVRRHAPAAFASAWRLLGQRADAEDAVQEALLDAFRLHSTELVRDWGALLRHLATRRAIDCLRARRAAIVVPLESADVAAPESTQPESLAIERELADRLRGAVAELPDREACVFSLRYFGELDNTAIARELGISTGAVGVALFKARKRLKDRFGLLTEATRRPGC